MGKERRCEITTKKFREIMTYYFEVINKQEKGEKEETNEEVEG